MEDFDDERAELNLKIKDTASLFANYFSNPENTVYQYLVRSYLYRDKIFDNILDDCSIFVSTMLRKITSYKTFIFIKYYHDVLEADIKNKL